MKNLLILIVPLLFFCFSANAQSCKISGSNDGSSILCTGQHMEGNNVIVNLSNDSENTCANVIVVVKVTYEGGATQEFEGRGKSCPNQDAAISVYINTENKGKPYKKYEVTRVSGNKCN